MPPVSFLHLMAYLFRHTNTTLYSDKRIGLPWNQVCGNRLAFVSHLHNKWLRHIQSFPRSWELWYQRQGNKIPINVATIVFSTRNRRDSWLGGRRSMLCLTFGKFCRRSARCITEKARDVKVPGLPIVLPTDDIDLVRRC